MSAWIERILAEFPADLARFWIAADPDNVLLDAQLLAGLRERGFELIRFEDAVAFRAEFEARYRRCWDRGEAAPAKALVLHLRARDVSALPWDYLHQARQVSLSLAELFPKLSYPVVRQIAAEHHATLFAGHAKYAAQTLGESASKEFILTHIYQFSPHFISRPEDLWRELLRLHYRDCSMPMILAKHVEQVLADHATFAGLQIASLFASKTETLRFVQTAWGQFLDQIDLVGLRIGDQAKPNYNALTTIPFAHPDVRAIVDSMFMDGMLQPRSVQCLHDDFPQWAKVGVVQDPLAQQNLVAAGIENILQSLPTLASSWRDWANLSRRLGEVISRFHALETIHAQSLTAQIIELQTAADLRLQQWLSQHYADLPSLPVANGPVMVHHVARFLSMRRAAGEAKIALLVFDGLAMDQWAQIREALIRRAPTLRFEESACFAWLPTLTSVSRQALFSGLKPREFADTIETTSPEPAQWSRFWQDQGIGAHEICYHKGIKRNEQLSELDAALSDPSVKVAGLVVDTVDEIVHGAILGKRGIASQIAGWCETGFIDRLLAMLLGKGFHVYLTADHGNVEAIGQGRLNQGVAPEIRGERVRTYRNETLLAQAALLNPNTFRLDVEGLPKNFLALYAGARTAFLLEGEPVVAHGGMSVEELIVPFVKITGGD